MRMRKAPRLHAVHLLTSLLWVTSLKIACSFSRTLVRYSLLLFVEGVDSVFPERSTDQPFPHPRSLATLGTRGPLGSVSTEHTNIQSLDFPLQSLPRSVDSCGLTERSYYGL